MERYTSWSEKREKYIIDSSAVHYEYKSYSGEPISRLARIKNLFEQLKQELDDVEQKMESLCRQGGARGSVYKQLAERKMMLESMLSYFRLYAGMK